MNGAAVRVVLQGQNTGAAKPVWVVFDRNCISYSGNCVVCNDSILFKFIKAVIGYPIIAAKHKDLNAAQRLAHAAQPFIQLAASLLAPSPRPSPAGAGEGADYSAASTRFFRLDAAPRASTGFKNCPV